MSRYLEPAVDVTGLGVQGGPPPEQSIRIPVRFDTIPVCPMKRDSLAAVKLSGILLRKFALEFYSILCSH